MRAATSIPWQDIEAVLLDMDGTLLDLAFDNFFWLELVPRRYALRHRLEEAEARSRVLSGYERVLGTLAWYSIDHWTRELELDIAALKWEHRHLISYLPGARRFLAELRALGKPVTVVTNAHPGAVRVKNAQTGLDAHVDGILCSHELDAPKESPDFWTRLAQRRPFDPDRTLLVEDSVAVLRAARAFGLRHAVAVRRPDSGRPPAEVGGFPAVDGVADLLEPTIV